jgi:hypothetical protein
MDLIMGEFLKALGYLFIAAVIFWIWSMSREAAIESGYREALFKGFLWCAGIAFFAMLSMGGPTCIDSETDSRGTICNEYADDGYEPTDTQRVSSFVYYFTLFYIPAAVGAFKAKKEMDR